tara:strand:+ start:1983 stop:3833 length:1851 start_codon:yes stop_codon:yes gene_type:complete
MATTWTRQSVNSANQVVSSSSSATEWSRIKITTNLGTNSLSLSDVDYITDSNGTGTLKNIDAIDATTEATIESAIDTLSNLTSIGTITTGVWNASAIGDSYISSASTWNAKQDALTFGISTGNVTKMGSGVVDDDFIRVNGTAFEGRSASEVLSDIGAQASLTFGISNTNAVKIDAADVADDDYARFTANGLEGRTLAEIKSDIGTGNSGLVPAAGSSGHFLAHNGAFAQVSYNNLSNKLADFDNDNAGLVPNPGSTGTTTKFLREDGSFAVPAYIANTNQLTTFTLGADGGTPQTIAHGNTLTISGGTGISTSVGATDQVEVSVNGVVLTTSNQSIGGNKTFTGLTSFDDHVKIDGNNSKFLYLDGAGESAYVAASSGTNLVIGTDGTDQITITDEKIEFGQNKFLIKERGSAGSDEASFGQIWVKSDTPNNLYFTNDAGNDVQITNGASLASGGSTTLKWHELVPGYRINNTSTTTYYTFYRNWFENWSNADSSPGTIAAFDAVSAYFIAPRAGTITNIKIQGYAQDTGATDPVKFYFYKAALSSNAGSMTLTHMFDTASITPDNVSKTFKYDLDVSSSNTFAEDDNLFVWLKKDSNTGSQDLYFNILINGEYS